MLSSYLDARHNIVVTVLVNWAQVRKVVELDFHGIAIDSLIPYVTSADDDLAAYSLLTPSDLIEIPARSIVTLVGYHSQRSLPPRNVSLAIHPGTVPAARSGVVPVSILGDPEFDVGEIDLATLELGPGGAHPTHRSGGHFGDVNGDGLIDLVAHFSAQQVGLAVGDEVACVTGNTIGGRSFEGCDAIRSVPR